ncbi:hypothetical protein FJU08_06775 [Martelella alba]|uniref:Uncharacterized protein n=1 Tax=Martelella alba TaxID=2590451 RepID=A0A506UCY2_9HYPH|nr:hypothetical protein [Martelella alba]TPW31458.1 hypothetical protein FJU08_06775 [Martelella alba]
MANSSLNGNTLSEAGPDTDASAPPAIDPTLFHYRVWRAVRAEWCRALVQVEGGQTTVKNLDAIQRRELEARDALLALTPTTLNGIAAVAHLLWDELGPSQANLSEGEYAARCASDPILKMIAAIWRAADGSHTPPLTD